MTSPDVPLILLALVLGAFALSAVATLIADAVITEKLRLKLTLRAVSLMLRGHNLLAVPLTAQTCNFCASWWHALWVVPGVVWVVELPTWWAAVLYLPTIGATKLLLDARRHEPQQPSALESKRLPGDDHTPGHETVAATMAALGVPLGNRPADVDLRSGRQSGLGMGNTNIAEPYRGNDHP